MMVVQVSQRNLGGVGRHGKLLDKLRASARLPSLYSSRPAFLTSTQNFTLALAGFGHPAGAIRSTVAPNAGLDHFISKPTWQIAARRIPVGQRPAAMQRSHPREAVANAEVLRRRV